MTFDAESFRRESAQSWSAAATGWAANRATFQAAMAPVSAWMLDALGPRPGHRLLELAAGAGDTGLMAAQRIQPGGTLICTDVAEEMLDAARARARELGLDNVEFRAMDAEWIDLPAADVDGVLCRFGYMLLADPAAALRETRRVLRPGGRAVLAAWTGAQHNPWNAVPREELRRLTGEPPPPPGTPGPLSFGDPARLEDLLAGAGFLDARIEQLDLTFSFDDLDTWWDFQLDLGASLREDVAALTPAQRDELRDAIDARLADHVGPDGSVRLPARTHVAVAEA